MDTIRPYLLFVIWVLLPCHGGSMVFFRSSGEEESKVSGGTRAGTGAALRRSKRGWMWNQFFLQEEYTGTQKQYVGKLQSDLDKGDGTVRYILSGEGADSIFTIEENTGNLHAIKKLDREEKADYLLRIRAVNRTTGLGIEPETEFMVKIHDINDNEPKFSKELYTASVPEMSPVGTSVTQVTATDADDSSYGNSAKLVYSILQGQPYFSVDSDTGIIKTALANMDREKREHYHVVIQAKDMAGQNGGLFGTTTVNITLLDVNDNPPKFLQSTYQFSIPESKGTGSEIGRIKATDIDIGENAEMDYSVIGGDIPDQFEIRTDKATQEGVIIVKQPLDYEKKKEHTLHVQVENSYPDPSFHHNSPFQDTASVKIYLEDVEEPPVFERSSYTMEVKEDADLRIVIGFVSATDHDAFHNPVRYSIDTRTNVDQLFNIHERNGSIYTQKFLDREESAWHNISVVARELGNPCCTQQSSRVPVYIRVLDVNDNAPVFDTFYEAYVCEYAKAGQTIQTVSAMDMDDPVGGHRFTFNMAPEEPAQSNFTVQDLGDNTAAILTRRSGFSRLHENIYQVHVVIKDGDQPVQSSTSTIQVHVCACDQDGNVELCSTTALIQTAGLSTGALVAILLCIIILLMIVVLFAAVWRQKKKDPLIISKEDVRDNIVSYNDEGGGEEDTQAFDIGTLQNPQSVEECKLRRDIIPEALYPQVRRAPAPAHENNDVRIFINKKVYENDSSPTALPYDSLATYAYEGNGSVAESLSSLGSANSDRDQDYNYLNDWGPRFRRLADLYETEDCNRYS
uniref:Cadherin 6 n=1 Tax=Scleropages formosus TaxID=113540 RepID=A0A8C9VBV7_SCLFO